MKNWKWFGNAGHFICSHWCRFHLCTQVGKYLISTVGEFVPDAPVREIYANCRNITLDGQGDDRLNDYMRKIGYQEIGYNRKYETMVFKAGKPCNRKDCNCRIPSLVGSELDLLGYNDARSATEGHMKLCRKWARHG